MQQHSPSSTRIYVALDKQPLGCAAQQQQVVVLAPTKLLLTPNFQLSVVLISFDMSAQASVDVRVTACPCQLAPAQMFVAPSA